MTVTKAIGAATLATLALLASPASARSPVPHGHHTPPHVLSPPGNAVLPCLAANGPTVTTIFRVRIHDAIEDLFKATATDNWVHYSATAVDDNNDDADYNASPPDVWQGGTSKPGEASFPYNIDISDVVQPIGQWVEIKFLLADNKKIQYYQGTSTSGLPMNGVTTDESFPVGDVCYVNPTNDDNGNDLFVYRLFVRVKANAQHTLHRFSLALVAQSGATDTPVIIDPKIMNNG